MLKRITRFIVSVACVFHANQLYSSSVIDSLYIVRLQDFHSIDSSFDGVLCIDFKLPRNFDITLIPVHIRRIRILKSSKIYSPVYELTDLKNLELCELTGLTCSLLPELIVYSDKLNTVILNNANLPNIWKYNAGYLTYYSRHIDHLYLRNCRMYNTKKMYEYSLIGRNSGFSCYELILQDCSEVMYYKIKIIEGIFNNQKTTLCLGSNCEHGDRNSVHLERRYSWIWRSILSNNDLRYF